LTTVGGTIYFGATDAAGNRGLWRTDGTDAGTSLVSTGNVTAINAANGTVFFTTLDAGAVRLWKTDGTAVGTTLLNGSLPTSAALTALYPAAGLVFFRTQNDDGTYQLWKSDGTAGGTARVGNVTPVAVNAAGRPTSPAAVGGVLYFAATAPGATSGVELWRSDGTDAGTFVVRDINPGAGDAGPSQLTVVGSGAAARLYFVAYDPTHGWALWASGGTPASTVLVRDGFTDGTSNPALSNLAAVGNTLFFSAADPNFGLYELWKSDGTTAGTGIVADLDPGFAGSSPSSITDVGGVAYFVATDTARGKGLWRSDGTPPGTVRIKDLSGNTPFYILNAGGSTYFADGGFLWKTDGTVTGTVQQMPFGATPSPLPAGATAAALPGTVVFAASDANYGRELFTVATAPPAAPSNAAASALAPDEARLTWSDNSANEAGFWIDRLVTPAGQPAGAQPTVDRTFFVAANTTQYLDTFSGSVAGGATVQYRVRSYNGGGASDFSNVATSTAPAPVLTGFTINDGAAQRSMITSVTLTFDRPLTFDGGAFTLVRRGGAAVTATASNPSGDGRTWVITFSGPDVISGSLADGVYDLSLPGAGNVTRSFHRLFGDTDGDGGSDNADLFQFKSAYGASSSDPRYRWYLDYDANGFVDNADVFQQGRRRAVTFKNY
jgi:ELWxxDGT repeat protein